MGFLRWAQEEWFNLFQVFVAIPTLLFTAFSLRAETKSRRSSNLIAIVGNHREVWTYYYSNPKFWRIRDSQADLSKVPVTEEEAHFVNLLILHLLSSYYSMKNGVLITQEELDRDIRQFFTKPIPKNVWSKAKSLQNKDFVSFVESSISKQH
jgi:hypothetical protein